MRLDLLVPTLRRPHLLKRALESIARTERPARLQPGVIVIVNDAAPELPGLQATLAAMPFPTRVLHEPAPGKSAALNTAIADSTADYLGFIDDDEVLAPDWFCVVEAALEAAPADFLGGPVVPFPGTTLPNWVPPGYPAVIGTADSGPTEQPCGPRFPGMLKGGDAVISRTGTCAWPAVTVVIPCFNQARFLPAAIASIRSQDHQQVDCIVVDDGSTDGTAAIAAELGVRVLRQSNKGVSESRNAGLAAAQSDLVVFLDADDELLPAALSRGAGVLASDPAAAAVVGRCQVMDTAGRSLPTRHVPVESSKLYEQWLSRNFVWAPGAAMFRRKALQRIGGFPAGLGPAADYAVYLRLAREGRVRVIADEVARYRQHDASMSRDPALMLRSTLSVLRREARDAPGPMRKSIRRARRTWSDWYGEQIVHRLRSDWRAGRRGASQVRAFATLIHRAPWVAFRHVRRKAVLILVSVSDRAALRVRRAASARRRKEAR